MRHADTVDKIVEVYLAGLCRESFIYKGKLYLPKPVVVSPLVLRGYTCPARCGACCGSFSLDYLPTETSPEMASPREVKLHGHRVGLYSDRQRDVRERWCRHLDRASGRCGIYNRRPFAGDFELIRFLIFADRVVVTQKQYGRAWAMTRLDTRTGALCEMLPADLRTKTEVIRKFQRLAQWAAHFGIRTCLSDVLRWLADGDHSRALRIPS
jgi:Putative zinc- or iron-chelating domain